MESYQPPKLRGYKILRKLGEGGYGAVYLATSKKTGEKVAIKFLTFRKVKRTKESEAKLKKEINVLKKLSVSPNCEPYLLCFVDHKAIQKGEETTYAIITEYIDGNDLFDLTHCLKETKKTLSEENLITLATHLVAGLAKMHEKGISHGDIKPENIMFTDKRLAIKIIDFGGACVLSNPLNCPKDIAITKGFFDIFALQIAYQSSSKPVIQRCLKAMDVYALGKTIWELASLKDAQEYYEQKKEPEPIFKWGYSKNLSKIISGMVNEDYRIRLTAEEALEALQKLAK